MTWSAKLAPGGAKTLYLLIPSITLTAPQEIQALQARSFEADAHACASSGGR